jgi:hypothetical protein
VGLIQQQQLGFLAGTHSNTEQWAKLSVGHPLVQHLRGGKEDVRGVVIEAIPR